MSALDFPRIRKELESLVLARTGTRLRKLDIQLSDEGVRLQGEAGTFYVKQLATHSVREMMPHIRLENEIMVR